MERPSIVICSALLSVSLAQPICFGQVGAAPARSSSQISSLTRPVDWGSYTARMFKDTTATVDFSLRTSWIPGADHKGMFRYNMSVVRTPPTPLERFRGTPADTPDQIEKLMRQVHSCDLTLKLFDVDSFLLRTVPIFFEYGADSDAHIGSLIVNSSTQMDASEYKAFVGTSTQGGSWSMSWACNP
jgi:hypothetical protein